MIKTFAEKWKESIIKYRKQCQTILKISNNIRYVGVINVYGRTLTGMVQVNLKPLLKSEQVKNEFFIISSLMSLRKDMSNSIGKVEHVVIEHQKIIIILIQKKDITYYVSINKKEKNLEEMIVLIKNII